MHMRTPFMYKSSREQFEMFGLGLLIEQLESLLREELRRPDVAQNAGHLLEITVIVDHVDEYTDIDGKENLAMRDFIAGEEARSSEA